MPDKSEREKRKASLRSWREAERKAKAAKLPLPPTQMRSMFDFVDERLGEATVTTAFGTRWLFSKVKKSRKSR